MTNYLEYTDDMNEISGCGGEYERACRAGVLAGYVWCSFHPSEQPAIDGNSGANGHVTATNEAGSKLLEAIRTFPFRRDGGETTTLRDVLTPHQYFLILQHVSLIASLGWCQYADVMRSGNEVTVPNMRTTRALDS